VPLLRAHHVLAGGGGGGRRGATRNDSAQSVGRSHSSDGMSSLVDAPGNAQDIEVTQQEELMAADAQRPSGIHLGRVNVVQLQQAARLQFQHLSSAA
jgi:hypothetical protein